MKRNDHSTKEKIYRGAYQYFKNGELYSDENFEVYRDIREQTFTFEVEVLSRVLTGEFLRSQIYYTISKEYIPVDVMLERTLGSKVAKEHFKYSSLRNIVTYNFLGGGGEIGYELPVPPKFHIMTPASCTSCLYLRSKKFDPTGKNVYSVVTSNNMWNYEEDPVIKGLVTEKKGNTTKTLKLETQEVQANIYQVWEYGSAASPEGIPLGIVDVYTSKHMSIPYLIETKDGIVIKIKYLNNLDQSA